MFDDADLLRALCGPNDGHLALIEEAFDVLLAAPGGQVTITGRPDARESARRVLKRLRDELAAGRPVGEEEVRAALHMDRAGRGQPSPDVIEVRPGKSFGARTPAQADYVRALVRSEAGLVFGVGPAGTGKTFLAVAYGAAQLAQHKVERLIFARPAVEAGEKLGYLPGDLAEKVDPYMLPIWDALRDTLGQEKVERRRAEGRIEVAPLAFMRGRTLSNAFVLIDEAQNATISQMQMVLTRIGEGTRMAVTGDPSQVDLPPGAQSGLIHALSILDGVEGVRAVRFTRDDVVRHPLVGRIVEAYERDARGRGRSGS
ncbi:MAG: PhoH family protein [Caulobacterales bacterium]|nr:PhoH family protein [Caulobacterales bacterium]